MTQERPSVRRSQIITTYGVGAIVPVGDESYMIAGIDQWNVGDPDVREPRLERKLGVDGFVQPPATGSKHLRDVPAVRFPSYQFCPACKRLDRHSFFAQYNQNKCNDCNVTLVPSRFVAVCENGHIEDFPYFEWVHYGKEPKEGPHDLSIDAQGLSASLGDVVIKCSCGHEESLQGAFGKDALSNYRKCSGRRPWLGDFVECGGDLRALQRGASNVYFGIVESALSIPPWSEGAFKVINRIWGTIKHIPDETGIRAVINGMRLAEGTPFTVDHLVQAVLVRKGEQAAPEAIEGSLRPQEYVALSQGREEASSLQDFVCVPAPNPSEAVTDYFSQVMTVKRLREVRALHRFTRLHAPSPADGPERRAPLYRDRPDWLPAIEVQGEGVFLRLEESRLRDWEREPSVCDRASKIHRNYAARFKGEPDRKITPRYVLIHTLAHVMIDQWSLECGYPAASLRERLYVAEESEKMPMAGFLIYTATNDSAGSLGGIVALAEGGRLEAALREAVRRTSWCSADPLCVEADAAGVDALNLAACHSCVLLPEVSCEEANTLLDRAMLTGTPEKPEIGFFADLLEGD